jgi:hypothetical protein
MRLAGFFAGVVRVLQCWIGLGPLAKDTPKPAVPPRPPKSPVIPLRDDQSMRPIGVPEEILIGRAVWEWTRLENCMMELLWRFTGLSFEDGRTVTERMDPARTITLLRFLGPRKLDGERLQTLIDLLATADQLRDDRNFVVHGTWAILDPEGVPTASSIRTKSEPGQVVAESFPHERMLAIIKAIQKTREGMSALLRTVPWTSE